MKQRLTPQTRQQVSPLLRLKTMLGIFIVGNILLAAFIFFNSNLESTDALIKADTLEATGSTFSLGRGVMISMDDFSKEINSTRDAATELGDFSFDISLDDMDLNLNWSFPAPKDYLYSEIERSEDMVLWNNVGNPNCELDSLGRASCNFSEMQPLMGNVYYRIRFIDQYNRVFFSQIKEVESAGFAEKSFTVSPRVIGNLLNINTYSDHRREATVAVFDNRGEVLWRMNALLHEGENFIGLNVADLAGHRYYVGFYSENEYQIAPIEINQS